ncbi:MAG: hypothetical protein ABI120_16565 [Gemmatimonadaceae bacterium]
MKPREKTELALIPVGAPGMGVLSLLLPNQLTVAELLGLSCAAWLVQGGIRDLWLIREMKKQRSASPQRRLACMCLESTAGLTGLCVAAGLTLANLGGNVSITPVRITILAAGVFLLGFIVKDYVISWRPLGLRRDPDHHSIVFTWW